MRKKIFGRRFKKNVNQRKALFRNLMRSLILNEEIKTTEAKAKAIKGEVEKLITMAKKGKASEYHLKKNISGDAVSKLVGEIGPRFLKRPGGYTRIVRLENRLKDNAEMVLLEFVEKGEKLVEKKISGKKPNKSEKKEAPKKRTTIDKAKRSFERAKAVVSKKTVTRQKKG